MPPPGYTSSGPLDEPLCRSPAASVAGSRAAGGAHGSDSSTVSSASSSSSSSSSDDEEGDGAPRRSVASTGAARQPAQPPRSPAVNLLPDDEPNSPTVHADSSTADLGAKLAELSGRDPKLATILSPRSKDEPLPMWLSGMVPEQPAPQEPLDGGSFDPKSSPDRIKQKLVELASRDPKLGALVTELPGRRTPMARAVTATSQRRAATAAETSPAVSPPRQEPVAPTGHEPMRSPPTAERGRDEQPPVRAARTRSSSGGSRSGAKHKGGLGALREKAARLRREKAEAEAAEADFAAAAVAAVPLQVSRPPEPEPEPEPEQEPSPVTPPSMVPDTVGALRRVTEAAANAPLTPVVTEGDQRVDRLLAGKGQLFEEIDLDGRSVIAGGVALYIGTRGRPQQQEAQLPPQQPQQLPPQPQPRPQLSPRAGAISGGTGATSGGSQRAHPAAAAARGGAGPASGSPPGGAAASHPYLEQYRPNAAKHTGSAAMSAAGRPTLGGGRRVASALRVAAPATGGSGATRAAVVNTILNRKQTSFAATAGVDRSPPDRRTLCLAAKVRVKAVAHRAAVTGQPVERSEQARRKVVRFASKDQVRTWAPISHLLCRELPYFWG